MNRDEDTILSAYLDGELDADLQQRFESALASDARLADELRSLALLRGLVSSLPRENSVDVSRQVMERVHAARPARPRFAIAASLRSGAGRVRIPAPARYTAAAAAIMLAVILGAYQLRQAGRNPAVGRSGEASASADRPWPAPNAAGDVLAADHDAQERHAVARRPNVAGGVSPVAHNEGKRRPAQPGLGLLRLIRMTFRTSTSFSTIPARAGCSMCVMGATEPPSSKWPAWSSAPSSTVTSK